MPSKPPLAEYRAKRDFSRSPEPAGAPERGRPADTRFFCVQKHLASHLHYDFRLEHHGVLLSWAVPKGPSLDPAIKRLAMMVEDHPLEYGEFEGVIPEGYGAGIVMLWDCGTWEPESPDVDQALRRGDLKMRLDGFKLKGSWVLVRTPRGGERSWLLIKHRDNWSSPDLDIAEFAPLSVKGGGDFVDILSQDRPEIWISNRPARGGEAGAMFKSIVEQALKKAGSRQRAAGGEKEAGSGQPVAGRKKAAATAAGTKAAGSERAAGRPVSAARAPSSRGSKSTPRPPGRTRSRPSKTRP